MAQNNAKVYWVENKITFIHGSVLDFIGKLEFDAAYFDPPWSSNWVYYFDKWKFKFSDYGVHWIDLIDLAKQKTTNIIFALPKNFDFSELDTIWWDFTITKEIVDGELFLYTLFLDPKNNFSNYTESIVALKSLNQTIEDNFINIPRNLVDYEVRKIVYNNTLSYLRNALLRTPQDKHGIIFNGYSGDMERIIRFCQKFVESDNAGPDEEFIKWLHKTLYPEGYVQKSRTPEWEEFVWMIPGEYKKIDIISKDNANKDVYLKPEKVEQWMQNIIREYQENRDNPKDAIFYFLADFFIVHPFGDGNGRVAYILTDLLLLQNNLPPLYLGEKKEKDKKRFYRILDEIYETRNLASFYRFVEW